MRIGVVGGGAVGLLISGYCAKEHAVTVYTRSKEQAELLQDQGLKLEKNGTSSIMRMEAEALGEAQGIDDDLLIIAVKQYQLETIMPILRKVRSKLLFVQNGMGHVKYLKELAAGNDVFVGVVEHGALKTGANAVVHSGAGVIKVAAYSGEASGLGALQGDADFPFIIEEDYLGMLTKKLIVNAMINPLTAIFEVPNGALLSNPYYQTVFQEYFNEIANVLECADTHETLRHVISVCKATASNRSSMLRDLEERRPTEVDSILGYILEMADQKQCHAPIARNLYLMVKGKEHDRREN
ncbi:MAG: 2-dehydropantoate 2-reductase [Bacillus sp. (in: firmicutes)]